MADEIYLKADLSRAEEHWIEICRYLLSAISFLNGTVPFVELPLADVIPVKLFS